MAPPTEKHSQDRKRIFFINAKGVSHLEVQFSPVQLMHSRV